MPLGTHPPETDLLLPFPGEGEQWDPHTIHTHYFGVGVPEAKIGSFIYFRYMPVFNLCQGGLIAYEGTNNLTPTDALFLDWEITMPWPEVEGNKITMPNGLAVEFPEPGKRAILTYTSTDGQTKLEVEGKAVTPLAARGHIVPGEEKHQVAESGGTEQFMHWTGELTIHGESHDVDCHYVRDRSWRQVRSESRDANLHPPIAWTPMRFGDDLAFNSISIEDPDTDPDWLGVYDPPPEGAPNHHFAWVDRGGGDVRDIAHVRRNVIETDPFLHIPLKMELEATDETGESYRFNGEAIATCPLAMWPNVFGYDAVYRWEDEQGRVDHNTMQGMHVEAYAQKMKQKRAGAVARAAP